MYNAYGERRVQCALVDAVVVDAMLRTGATHPEATTTGVPVEAKLLDVRLQELPYAEGTDYRFIFVYEHPDFPVCLAGAWMPVIGVTVQRSAPASDTPTPVADEEAN